MLKSTYWEHCDVGMYMIAVHLLCALTDEHFIALQQKQYSNVKN